MSPMPYVTFELEPGVNLIVEEPGPPAGFGPQEIGVDEVIKKAAGAFEHSLESVSLAARKVYDVLVRKMPERPDEVEIEFGVKFSAKLDAWVVGSEGEGSFSVKITWKPAKPPQPPIPIQA